MMGTLQALSESANPRVWFRALVMDLGFAGLIEEIEKRFGKTATTFLLGMLFLAVILWALKLVMGLFVEISTLSKSSDLGDLLLAMAYRLGFVLFAASFLFGWMVRRVRKEERQLDERVRKWRDDDIQMRSEIESLLQQLGSKEKEVIAKMDELERRRDETHPQSGER